MQQTRTPAPFLTGGQTVRSSMLDMLLCQTFLLVWSVFLYGPRTLLVAGVSLLSCLAAEYLASRLAHLPHTLWDFSAAVSAMTIALLCPVTVPLWAVAVMGAVAMLVAKAVFGGLGHNPFNPAAAAIALGTVAWPMHLQRFPIPFQPIPLLSPLESPTLKMGQTILSFIKQNGTPNYRMDEILYGIVPEAMGTSAFLVILACFAYLVVRKTIGWRITLSYLSTVVLLATLFPRAGGMQLGAFFELSSGYLLFAAVFILNDPSTAPKSPHARILYGVVGGALTVLFRYFGTYTEGLCFAVLIVNALGPTFDRMAVYFEQRRAGRGKSKNTPQRIFRRKKA